MDDESLSTSIAEHESYRHSHTDIERSVRDENAPKDHDGRAKTRSFFYHDDYGVPTKGEHWVRKFGTNYENKWQWLNELQEERYGNDNNERLSPTAAKRDLRTWMNQLHCQDHQIEWACQVYDSTPSGPSATGYVGGHKNEAVLLSIITLVLNTDVNKKVRDEDHFQDLRESCDVRKDDIRIIRKKLRPLL